MKNLTLTNLYFINRPNQESQKIFKAALPMDATQVKTKLIGYGFSLLEGIDPNPEVIISNNNRLLKANITIYFYPTHRYSI